MDSLHPRPDGSPPASGPEPAAHDDPMGASMAHAPTVAMAPGDTGTVTPTVAPDPADPAGSEAARAAAAVVPTVPSVARPAPPPETPFPAQNTADSPGHRPAAVPPITRLPMLPLRLLALVGVTLAFGLAGWKVQRSTAELPPLTMLTVGSLAAGVLGAVGLLAWTWVAAENARRLVSPATTHELPSPWFAVTTWIVPLVFVAAATASVTIMSNELNSGDETSSFPMLVAFVSLVVALPLMYRPALYLAGVVRQVGGHSVNLLQWLWVPVVLGLVGVGTIIGLRIGGAFGEQSEGLAPTWVIGVAAIVPCLVVIAVGWRAGEDVEEVIAFGFDRRLGRVRASRRRGIIHRRLEWMFGHDGPNHALLAKQKHIRQLPGADALRLALVTALAGLALLSVVGGIVMFLFWREADNGVLVQSQRDRAWDVLDRLQSVERLVAFGVVGVVVVWTFVNVLNARLASGRRRNPVLASAAWPIAGLGIWAIGDRWVVDGTVVEVIGGFFAQAVVLYVPFFLLERAATSVGARRTPFRIVYVFGVVLLVHIQGLGGLSTIADVDDTARYGRLAGYLALGAIVQLLSTLAVTDASSSIADASAHEAEHHNFLAEQRRLVSERQSVSATVAPDHEG